MMTAAGAQGVGKTYENMHIIQDYIKDKIASKVRGRKCLILDTNGEYTEDQFAENGVPNFKVKTIKLADVGEWCRSGLTECRRIDMRSASIKDKKKVIEHVVSVFVLGMLVLEDINTAFISMTHMENIVSGLVNLRHKGADVLISFQSLRAVEPLIYRNSRWVRMHYQIDNVSDIKGKIPDVALYKIAQLIVNSKYHQGGEHKHFFLTINCLEKNLKGKFTLAEFQTACEQYLMANKKDAREFRDMNNCSMDEAIKGQIGLYTKQYYGNV